MEQGPPEKHAGFGERRRGNDRRRLNSRSAGTERLQLLLARLLSMLLGALVGFFTAYIISWLFVSDFRDMLTQAETKLAQAQQDEVDYLPSYGKANQDYQQLYNQLYPGSASSISHSSLDDIPPAPDIQPPLANDPQPQPPGKSATGAKPRTAVNTADIAPADLARLEELRKNREDLRSRLEGARTAIRFWGAEIGSYKRSLLTLDYLSGAVVLVLTLLGYLGYPLVLSLLKRIATQWEQFSLGPEPRLVQAIVGFFAGLILSVIVLLAIFNSFGGSYSILSNPAFRLLFGTFVVAALGAAGALTGVAYFSPPPRELDPFVDYRLEASPKILDSSVLIDGRVLEIATSGFLSGAIVVTSSVLRELQSMADSADERKRGKGRRGLELVRRMQDDPRLNVSIFDDTRFDSQAHGTDDQLILVASAMDGIVATNDYNLNRVAAIRDVRVININALANAVKTNLLPGDIIEIAVADRGKQKGQGVGYLDDGTMVVVEDGEPHIKHTKVVKITSVTQTVQGRLIFGRVDAAEEEGASHA